MKIIFFGTPEYVLPILKALAKNHEIVAVVTQPPMPVGREQFKKYSPVDDWAYKRDIKILRDLDIGKFPGADLGVCAAYGKIIPQKVLDIFKFGILNIHPSLLPKYRGASPINEAIKNGDLECGVTIIKMDAKMDHGPIITQFREDINPEDTTDTLRRRLFERSAQVLIDLIPNYLKGKIKIKEQNDNKATFTKVLTKEDGFVDFKKDDPVSIERKLKAYSPWPGIWTLANQKRLKILEAHLDINHQSLTIDKVQLEGKDPVSWKQFKEGYPNVDFL